METVAKPLVSCSIDAAESIFPFSPMYVNEYELETAYKHFDENPDGRTNIIVTQPPTKTIFQQLKHENSVTTAWFLGMQGTGELLCNAQTVRMTTDLVHLNNTFQK